MQAYGIKQIQSGGISIAFFCAAVAYGFACYFNGCTGWVSWVDVSCTCNIVTIHVGINVAAVIVVIGGAFFISVFNTCHKRSEEHTSELQSRPHLVCRLLLEKTKRPPRQA